MIEMPSQSFEHPTEAAGGSDIQRESVNGRLEQGNHESRPMDVSASIELVWPPSILSGHAKGNLRWAKICATKQHREWARLATLEVMPPVPGAGDIPIRFTFVPPDNRGDRTNFPNRLKPAIDGIAEALGVNDKRFLPSYAFRTPEKPGRIIVEVMPL